jgi:hypothetical protein
MGLMDQLGQAASGTIGGQTGQNPLLQALTSLLGQNRVWEDWPALSRHFRRTDSAIS